MTENNQQPGNKICRKFNLTIISAVNLPNVRTLFKNRIQATITIGSDKKSKKKSPVDKRNGLNPAWNYRVKHTFEESSIINDTTLRVVIKLYSKRAFGDIYVGEVHTSLKELFDWARGGSATFAFPIKKGAAAAVKTNGVLNVTYSFGERYVKKPSGLWKKVLVGGAVILLRLTLCSIVGV